MENLDFNLNYFLEKYPEFRDNNITGRLVAPKHIQSSLQSIGKHFKVKEIGKSTLGESIHSISLGSGKIKVLAWSQMHGNESTTTKAVFDLLNAFIVLKENEHLHNLLEKINLKIIPILNPDGANVYTRENANKVDLNRDAYRLKEVESRILREVFDSFEPDFCLNLHDQRTIFSAGEYPNPAILSFLAPAMDPSRKITSSRKRSMAVIAGVNKGLQSLLPKCIGRYDDSYNRNCTGDTFQSLGVPTILFEAGHHPGDYQREKTREFVTYALIATLKEIALGKGGGENHEEYFSIPENQKMFYDVILREALLNNKLVDIAIQFKETFHEDQVIFIPFLEKIEPQLNFFAHREIHCGGEPVRWKGSEDPVENVVVKKIFIKNEILIIN